MCVFFDRKDQYFRKINISHDYKEKYLEICAIELETKSSKLIILSLYGVPTRDFNQFVKNLDDALKHTHKPKMEFLIYGDINTDYLTQSKNWPHCQEHTICCTQLILQQEFKINSSTATDNTSVDKSRINLSSKSPIINGLSDHDAQILTIKNIYVTLNKLPLKQRTSLIDNETITNFQTTKKTKPMNLFI